MFGVVSGELGAYQNILDTWALYSSGIKVMCSASSVTIEISSMGHESLNW